MYDYALEKYRRKTLNCFECHLVSQIIVSDVSQVFDCIHILIGRANVDLHEYAVSISCQRNKDYPN